MSTSGMAEVRTHPWTGTITAGPSAGQRIHLYDVGYGWHISYVLEHDDAKEVRMLRPMDAERLRAWFATLAVEWDLGLAPAVLAHAAAPRTRRRLTRRMVRARIRRPPPRRA